MKNLYFALLFLLAIISTSCGAKIENKVLKRAQELTSAINSSNEEAIRDLMLPDKGGSKEFIGRFQNLFEYKYKVESTKPTLIRIEENLALTKIVVHYQFGEEPDDVMDDKNCEATLWARSNRGWHWKLSGFDCSYVEKQLAFGKNLKDLGKTSSAVLERSRELQKAENNHDGGVLWEMSTPWHRRDEPNKEEYVERVSEFLKVFKKSVGDPILIAEEENWAVTEWTSVAYIPKEATATEGEEKHCQRTLWIKWEDIWYWDKTGVNCTYMPKKEDMESFDRQIQRRREIRKVIDGFISRHGSEVFKNPEIVLAATSYAVVQFSNPNSPDGCMRILLIKNGDWEWDYQMRKCDYKPQ